MSLDVRLIPNKLTDIKEPDLESTALIASTISQAGVPAALWGLNAANLYGGNLVPLDIELLVCEKDQERAFTILTSHGLIPSLPDDDE
ncbi:hypothetical protein SI65_04770 [Aspergillus cristatus]|uniref:DUF2007 domain-containing protein n=1 Tax=Aspergillus cristatus TaxID=573508 RepID=A0A1E3BFQ8_ASPCR|nr:hypothetical protein SI65_04770 [Aspergillus cristatus]